MRSICGWIGNGPDCHNKDLLIAEMGRHMVRPSTGALHTVIGMHSALCIDGTEPTGNICEREGALVAVSGRFRWKSPKLDELDSSEGAAIALLRGYEEYGADVLRFLSGDFNVAFIRESDNQFLVATDRVGTNPISYAEAGEILVFGPDAATLILHPSISDELNVQSIFDYIYFHFVPAPESIYSGVRRLYPGEYLEGRGGRVSAERYWQANYDESAAGRSFVELRQELQELVKASVDNATSQGTVGAFLSGGVDSSTITGVLGLVQDAAPRTYSIGFDVDSYDELSYARLAANHFSAEHHEYLVTPEDVIAAVPVIANFYAEPFGNSSVVPTYFCAKMAQQDGIQTLLGGDGGDELFGGNERYAKQKLFAVYDETPTFVKNTLLEPFFLASRIGDSFAPIHKVRRYIEQATIAMPDRLQTYNFLNHFAPEQIFEEALLSQISQQRPLALLTEYYEDVKADTIVDKMLGLDLKFTLADNDLIKVGGACKLAGVTAAYPLLSDELIEFSTSLPPKLKVKGQVLRHFFKKAYQGFLPDETLSKSKHGFGLPFGEWTVSHPKLRAFVQNNLDNLKSRQIVRPDFIDRLVQSYLPEHPQYYGSIVWLLLMLEQWHQQHGPG